MAGEYGTRDHRNNGRGAKHAKESIIRRNRRSPKRRTTSTDNSHDGHCAWFRRQNGDKRICCWIYTC